MKKLLTTFIAILLGFNFSTFAATPIMPYSLEHVHGSSIVELGNGDILAVWFRAERERRDDDGQIEGAIWNAENGWSSHTVVAKTQNLPDTNPTVFIDQDGVLQLMWVAIQGNEWGGAILMQQRSEDYQHSQPGQIVWQAPQMVSVKPANDYDEGNPTAYETTLYAGYQSLRTQPLPELGNITWEAWALPYCLAVHDEAICHTWIQELQNKVIGVKHDGTLINIANPMETEIEEADTPDGHSYLPGRGGDRVRRSIGWMTRNFPLQLDSGRILLPLYSDFQEMSMVAISDDQGKTWHTSQPIVGFYNVQPSFIAKENGDIVAYMRDNGRVQRVYESTSRDKGETWTPAINNAYLAESGSGLQVLKLENDLWTMLVNDLVQDRYRLSLYISNNEGDSWQHAQIIAYDADGLDRFSYPAMLEDNGLLHITYTHQKRGTTDEKAILHTMLPVKAL